MLNILRSKVTPGRALTACAGVVIAKPHYPFAQAYDLAEELTANAKRARGLA